MICLSICAVFYLIVKTSTILTVITSTVQLFCIFHQTVLRESQKNEIFDMLQNVLFVHAVLCGRKQGLFFAHWSMPSQRHRCHITLPIAPSHQHCQGQRWNPRQYLIGDNRRSRGKRCFYWLRTTKNSRFYLPYNLGCFRAL